ncbi:MAG: class I SAM-dependent methyltransferase [Bacteroidota bacterium]
MKPGHKISAIRINIAIGILSAAIIAFQLTLMQILSFVQWYHFAYMIISMALLGFGAAGTFLTLFREKLIASYEKIFFLMVMITALFMPIVVILAHTDQLRFDSLLIFQNFSHLYRLILSYFLFFLPFFTGALAIGLSFLKFANQIDRIYFSNLVGSGVGSILAIVLPYFFLNEQMAIFIAVLTFLGGLIVYPPKSGKAFQTFFGFSILVLVAFFFLPFKLKPSEYKDISKTLLLPEAKVHYANNSAYGLVQVVSSPVLRYAPGLSLSYKGNFPIHPLVFNNGNWLGPLISEPEHYTSSILNFTSQALAYRIDTVKRVLILNAGTGVNIALALNQNAEHIGANEANPEVYKLLQNSFSAYSKVKLQQSMSRTFLAKEGESYDLIQIPTVGTFFGNSGLNAIETHFELSIEAFQKMWDLLSANGAIAISCWMENPPRNSFRILATLVQLLDKNGIKNPEKHIIAVRSWSDISFILKKTAYTNNHSFKTHEFCSELMFDPLILPDLGVVKNQTYNRLQDSTFFEHLSAILHPDKNDFLENYPFRVQPATDNQPFFYQNIRWPMLMDFFSMIRKGITPIHDLGYVLVWFTFIQIISIAAILIILPLFFNSWKSKNKLWIIVYFSGIGLSFIYIELVFLQHFQLYFGNFLYASAASIGLLLIASGCGSYFSRYISFSKWMLVFIPILIAFLLLLHSQFITNILTDTMTQSLSVKIIIASLIIGITGFFMGIPFPAGIKFLSDKSEPDIAWAWALNGYFSVIGASLATIILVEAGIVQLLILAAIVYFLVGLSTIFIRRT